jgi:hypothetical protein
MRYTLIMIAPLIIALIMLAQSIVRNLARAYLEHRVKLALLEMLERKPELLRSNQELEQLLEDTLPASEAQRPLDLVLTGVILAVIGAICAVIYTNIGSGRWAVGAYWGGVACVVLGFLLALVGLVVRWLDHAPLERR